MKYHIIMYGKGGELDRRTIQTSGDEDVVDNLLTEAFADLIGSVMLAPGDCFRIEQEGE